MQIATLNYQADNKRQVTRKYLPYVFTEQGIAMLSGLLKNEIAIQVSINIMNAFVEIFIDDSILKMLAKKNKNVEVVILTSQNSNLTKLDINKFNKQYPTLKIAKTDKFHDRFIVIDNKELYHCGASLKDLGKKCFAISKIEDKQYVEKISNSS